MDDYADDSSATALLDLSFTDNFGIIDFSGDQDWLRMELAAGTSYEIHVHGQDLGFQLAAPRIRVFDSSNNLIASDDATDGGVVLTFTAFTYGTHFLAIDSADPTDIGTYNFHGFGDDNSGSERLTINSQTQGALEYFADQDSFLVRLVAGIPYTFDLRGQASAGGTLLDPLLLLLDSSGATVASGDDLGLGADSSIQFTPTTSGDYRLAAQSSGANDLGSYTISASAPALGLAIAATDADRAEGNSGSTPFTFTITRSDSLTAALNVAWQVTGTGANPADAADFATAVLDTGPSGNIAFAAGEASKALTVNVRGDTLVEASESFLVSVSSPANGAATAMGVIRNDDGAPAISIAATTASLLEGSSGAETPYGFTVTRSGSLAAANSVAWAVSGTGANPADAADFTNGVLPSGTISFAVGEASKTIVVGVHGDTRLESDEGFLVNLSHPTNNATIGTGSANGLIRNDDTLPSISVATTATSSIVEGSSGETAFGFTVTRSGDVSAANAVGWAVAGSGLDPADATDFTGNVLPTGTITFAAGETSKTLTVSVHGDTLVEPDEGFQVTLSGPTNGATLGADAANGLIRNDDSATSISIATTATSSAAEGSSGETGLAFTVTRSGDLSATNAVAWAVTGSGTNPANAADFTGGVLPSGTISFAAGEASKTLSVSVDGDTRLEPNESFQVTLSSPTNGAVIGTTTASGLIQNDDIAPSIAIAATNATLPEGTNGETAFGFTITRTGDLTAANAVAWSVAGSGPSPANPADFTGGVLPSGTTSFAAGEASKTLSVNVHGDTQLEPNEGFQVTLSGPTNGAVLGTATASGLIQNDDIVPSISLAATNATHAEGSTGETAFGFTVTRSGDLSAANAVAWAVAGSSASPANAADFTGGVLPSGTVSFAAGEASRTLSASVHGDTLVELNEGFVVTLSGPTNGAVLGTATANGLIQNDDTSISIAITATSSLAEGSTGEIPHAFTVTRSGDLSVAHAVAWAVAGSGTSPANAADFTGGVLPSGTVSFAVGEASKTLMVSVHGDTLVEPNEGFQVTLSGPTNGAVIGTAAASGLIQNDDASLNAVNGTANGETLTGTLGADHLQGLGGNDSLIGRAGNDILDGGTGTDRADWLSDGGTLAVNVDMVSGTATRGTEIDTLLNIEDLRGTQFADTLQGNDSVNLLDGNAGNDTLNGRGGDDLLAGSTGSNTLDGGAGTDRVTYSGSSTAISLDLGTDTVTRGTETDRIFNIENATGSPSADTMRGDTANNLLQGLGGNDTLLGLDGNDTIAGGAGKDSMTGGTGRDLFDFAAGESGLDANADIINGFDGVGATAGDTIDLRDVFSGTLAFRGTSAFSGINQVHLVNEGTATIVEINLSGTTAPEMEIRVEDGATTAASWTAADFLL